MLARLVRGATPHRVRSVGAALAAAAFSGACAGPDLAARHLAQRDAFAQAEARALSAQATAAPAMPADDPFRGAPVLDRRRLVDEVLRRNPSLAAARSAWRAALARYPQETALEDPMLGYAVGPRSFDTEATRPANMVEVSQAIPFPGKLGLRGEIALAEADGAASDFEAARLRLATIASGLFDRWYLVARETEINAHHREILDEMHRVSLARYASGTAMQQDPLAAELEAAELLHASAELESERSVVAAQIAALLHLPPDAPLPPPPAALALPPPSEADEPALVESALAARPDLGAARSRVRAGESQVALAKREFFPDFKLSAKYDGFWEVPELRPAVGLEMNVPLQIGRRRAALEQAEAELDRSRSEAARAEDQVRLGVRTALAREEEARHLLGIYRDRLLPAARDRLVAARASFETGQTGLGDVLESDKKLREIELGLERATADVARRIADLDRAAGRIPDLP